MDKTRTRFAAPVAPRQLAAASNAAAHRPRRGVPARAVGSFVPRITQKAMEKYGFSTATLLTDWAVIAGPDLAAYTAPERLKWPRQVSAYRETESGGEGRPGATLLLRVDGARALDVQYKARQIADRINAYFGYRAVAEIRLIQAPVERRGPHPRDVVRTRAAGSSPRELADAGNDRLGAALARLQASMLSERDAGPAGRGRR